MTTMPCVVDTSAWIEWLADTALGRRLGKQLPDKSQCIVPTIMQLERTCSRLTGPRRRNRNMI